MTFFNDPNQPPPEDDVAENILTPGSMKKCQVITTWTPTRDTNIEPPPTQQRTFLSTPAATEWIKSTSHDPRATGSPKQLRLKRAAILMIPAHLLDLFEPTHTIQPLESADVHTPRVNPLAGAGRRDRNPAPDPAPVPNRPAESIFGGRDPLSSILSDDEIAFLSSGSDPADDGEEE